MKTREYQKDGFAVTVDRVLDEDADLSYLEDYADESPSDRAKYLAQGKARLEAYDRGEWYMLGIVVTIRKQTPSNWANGGLEVGRASIWGYESDSEEGFLKSEEESIASEAWREVEQLKASLAA